MQRTVSSVPSRANIAGMMRSSVGRLWGKPDSRNDAVKLPSTRRLPRSSERRRGSKTAKYERRRIEGFGGARLCRAVGGLGEMRIGFEGIPCRCTKRSERFLFWNLFGTHRDLPAFPTRPSSD